CGNPGLGGSNVRTFGGGKHRARPSDGAGSDRRVPSTGIGGEGMRRHAFDPLSFAFGLIFAVTGGAFMIGGADVFDHRLDRLWPFALNAVGLATIIAGAGWGRVPRTRPDGADRSEE